MTQNHFFAIATALSVASSFSHTSVAQTAAPLPPPGRTEVCRQVLSMPGASNTDELMTLLRTNRVDLLNKLRAMKGNMEQYNAEGIGWQNAIEGSSALQPRPGSWLIGALRIACESQTGVSSGKVTGSVRYRQRIALPSDARLVVKLEDVSRADAPSVVIAEQTIVTAGRQVPIPFELTYDPAQIQQRNRYVVRAQIFYSDKLRWTSTRAYPVITQGNPSEVTIALEAVQ